MLDRISRLAQNVLNKITTLCDFVAGNGAHADFIRESGFTLSKAAAQVVRDLKFVAQAIREMTDDLGNYEGANLSVLDSRLAEVIAADAAVAREIVEFVCTTPAQFIARFNALSGTEAYELLNRRFNHDLTVFRKTLSQDGITSDRAVVAYTAMIGLLEYIEGRAKIETSPENRAQTAKHRIVTTLTSTKEVPKKKAGRSAAKRAADAQLRASMKQPKGQKPQVHRAQTA